MTVLAFAKPVAGERPRPPKPTRVGQPVLVTQGRYADTRGRVHRFVFDGKDAVEIRAHGLLIEVALADTVLAEEDIR